MPPVMKVIYVDSLYELTQTRDRGPAKDIVKSIEPEYLEIANTLLDNA